MKKATTSSLFSLPLKRVLDAAETKYHTEEGNSTRSSTDKEQCGERRS